MTPADLTHALKTEAHRLGFELAGACAAVAPPRIERFRQWLEAGYAGQMYYLSDRGKAYEHPRHVLDGVCSLLMLAVNYPRGPSAEAGPDQGKVARYARGVDYHEVIHERLHRLAEFHRRLTPDAHVRGVVDTAPLLEREFAELAGLGWIGKNTLLLNPQLGSWFFLAALLTSETLECDEPISTDHCGKCRACLDACPTGALIAPYQLDARRCISYLTIELKGPIPEEFREPISDWLFGCDVCQDVCPWNRRSPVSLEQAFPAETDPLELAELFFLDEADFRQRFRGTPFRRPKRRGLLRNAAIVLGNRTEAAALPALVRGLNDSEPMVRSACAWALGRYRNEEAQSALRERLSVESDLEVRRELHRTSQTGENTK